MSRFIICLDGLSGAGKTCLSSKLCQKINAEVFSFGSICRAVSYYMELNKMTVCDKSVVDRIMNDRLAWRVIEGMLGNPKLQDEKYARGAVKLFLVPEVARWCIDFMRLQTFGAGEYPMVFEGRGNGWLFPNAAIKIWLDADENVRFRRKHGDAERFGAVAYSDTVKSLSMRAGIEARNAIISAKPAPGAIRIDTTYMTEDEVLAAVLAIYNNKRRGFGWKSGVNIWLPILAKSKIILRRVVSRMEILADRLIYIMCQWPVRPQAA